MFERYNVMKSNTSQFDVVVFGAGPAGAATARWLAQSNYNVLLIEHSSFDKPRVGESLAPAVQPLLRELGVWNQFEALDPLPSWGTRSVWGSEEPQSHSHMMNPYGSGWHVDRLQFDCMLANAAVEAGATLYLDSRLVSCHEDDNGNWTIRINREGAHLTISSRIVVDATGRRAQLARQLGATRVIADRLMGVTVQYDSVSNKDQCYTLVETSTDGWWYSAPVGENRMMAMLMTDSDICHQAALTVNENWQNRLHDSTTTASRIGKATSLWGPRVFSAVSHRLRREDTAAKWLAVGDSALSVDPVSGSGVVRALRTARAGAESIVELLNGDAASTIEHYEAERDREFREYLNERRMYYQIEYRWRDSLFWQRRL